MSSLEHEVSAVLLSRIRDAASEVFHIQSVTVGEKREPLVKIVGEFLIPPDRAYPVLMSRLKQLNLTALFRREGEKESILVVPDVIPSSGSSSHWNVILLVLTALSTLFVGTMMVSPDVGDFIVRPWLGLPFALSLMVILGAHELGHYFAARQFGVPVTLPYFIPMPLGPFGTLGAFISMKSPPPNRGALLTIAAAGPLSGFVLAVPILLLGLSMSPVTPLLPGDGVLMEGNSILYALFKIVTFGRFLPSGGEDVLLHPVAFAGWAGLLVTGLNLMPVGQLDGGHIMYALLGERSRYLVWPIAVTLIGLGTIWSGWFLWVILLFVFGRQYAAPMDDLTTLTAGQRVAAWLVLVLFVMIFTPLPLTVY